MNYKSHQGIVRMRLEEALNTFANEICYLTLKDGTNIEIIQNKPKMDYIDDKYNLQYDNEDEFIEEFQEENTNDFKYQNMELNQPELLLRGRGQNKKLGKTLRKTVLKSIDGKEKEKEIKKGKLRNLNNKIIFQQTESNDFLQCAHCFKFFHSDENEEEKEKTTDSNSNYPQTQNKLQLPPQQQNNQFIHPNQPGNKFIPPNQQKGPQKPPQPPQQVHPGQKMPQMIPKHQQQQFHPPQPQKVGPNQRQRINIPQGRPNQIPIPQQFRAQNQVFRARKKNSNRYESNNDRYFNSKNNYYLNNNVNNYGKYFYPASGKKKETEYILCEECSSGKKMKHNTSYGNLNVARNLNYGFSEDKREDEYIDNIPSEYMNNDHNEYYEYPSSYQRKNYIPAGYNQDNNRKVVTIRTVRNEYQDYDYY